MTYECAEPRVLTLDQRVGRRKAQGEPPFYLGRRRTNSDPSLTWLETVTVPPWAWTTALTRLKPSPKPRCERLLSPRYRRIHILSCSSSGIPMPVSRKRAIASAGRH